LARILRAACRTLIAAGVLILLFVAYQVWGTSIRTAQAQRGLDSELADRLATATAAGAVVSGAGASTTSTSDTTAPAQDPPAASAPPVEPAAELPAELVPAPGEAAGRIEIPAIGVDWTFVEGVSVGDLKKGPGHYPETPWPGQANNAAIAGHRTTYGQPFHDLDQLEPGDQVVVTTIQGEFVYSVRETKVVDPEQVEVLGPDFWDFDDDPATPENSLTLTACHPKFSATERIVVATELLGPPAPPTPPGDQRSTPVDANGLDADLSGEGAGAWPVVAWAVVAAGIALGAWAAGRRHPDVRWMAYAVGLLPFLVALFFFFENFSTLLPANY
jgi:sortase A